MANAVRWTISVSSETDKSLRSYLGMRGMKKGDISKFVEDAVRWRMLDHTVQTIKDRNQDMPPEDLESLINDAVNAVRNEHKERN